MINNIKADKKFENRYNIKIEKVAIDTPKIKACFFETFPVGIGLKHVLDIKESTSASYQQFKAPAAPEPSATAIIDKIALK